MVSGADSLDTYTDTSTRSANSSSIMETEETDNTPPAVNGTSSNNTSNGNIEADADNNTEDNDMELEGGGLANNRDNSILSNPAKFECLIRFGRSLHVFHQQLEQDRGRNPANTQMLQDAFSLLAYPDPWNSTVGGQLDPSGREPVCAQLNSAILESKNLPGRPPLEVSVAHTSQLL